MANTPITLNATAPTTAVLLRRSNIAVVVSAAWYAGLGAARSISALFDRIAGQGAGFSGARVAVSTLIKKTRWTRF